jgi:DNA-binding MarR family transcriptional regulator
VLTGRIVMGLTVGLGRKGHMLREFSVLDRRTQCVRLTAPGERAFARRAGEDESWVHKLLRGPSPAAQQSLHDPLGRLRSQVGTRTAGVPTASRKGA